LQESVAAANPVLSVGRAAGVAISPGAGGEAPASEADTSFSFSASCHILDIKLPK
jgi:hypothetical protein